MLQGSDTTQRSSTNEYYPHFIIHNIHSTNSVILLQGSDTTQLSKYKCVLHTFYHQQWDLHFT
jgi:hypothetical protein